MNGIDDESDALARELGRDFDPGKLSPKVRDIFDSWREQSPANATWVRLFFGSARMLIARRRRIGVAEGNIRDEFLGHAHDHADSCSLPNKREGNPSRGEYLAVMREIYDQAAAFTGDDFPPTGSNES